MSELAYMFCNFVDLCSIGYLFSCFSFCSWKTRKNLCIPQLGKYRELWDSFFEIYWPIERGFQSLYGEDELTYMAYSWNLYCSCWRGIGMTSRNLDTEEFIKKFHIPSYVLDPESKDQCVPFEPKCPVLVFINSKSGGQLGGNLLITFRSILNRKQVKSANTYFVSYKKYWIC